MSSAVRFWISALGMAAGIAVVAWLLLPYEWLGLETANHRERGWLLTVFTAGVLGILFGASSLLGGFTGIGFRDVAAAQGTSEAMQKDRAARATEHTDPYHRNFGWWIVCTGGLLLLVYFTWWLALGRPGGAP